MTVTTDMQIRTLSWGQKSSRLSVLQKSFHVCISIAGHVWQKWSQYCKAVIHQLKINKFLKIVKKKKKCPIHFIRWKNECSPEMWKVWDILYLSRPKLACLCQLWTPRGRANPWDIRAYCKPQFCFLGKPCEGSSLDSLISKDDGEAPLPHSWVLWGLNQPEQTNLLRSRKPWVPTELGWLVTPVTHAL